MIKKLNTGNGFTLAETLMTVLILLLVSSVIAAGIPAAVNAYTKAVDAANAQVLLSTTVNALRRELSTAWEVDADSTNECVTYYSSRTGAKTKLYNNSGAGEAIQNSIKIQNFMNYGVAEDPSNPSGEPADLVSESARDGKYVVVFETPSISNGIISFSDIKVYNKDHRAEGNDLASSGTLSIRLLKSDFTIPELLP